MDHLLIIFEGRMMCALKCELCQKQNNLTTFSRNTSLEFMDGRMAGALKCKVLDTLSRNACLEFMDGRMVGALKYLIQMLSLK